MATPGQARVSLLLAEVACLSHRADWGTGKVTQRLPAETGLTGATCIF